MVAWIDEVNEAVLNIPKPSYSPACTNYTYYNPNTAKPGVNLSSNRNVSKLKNERKNKYYSDVQKIKCKLVNFLLKIFF